MPTLPMYQSTEGSADACHRVTAPGGYEWWYFDAEDVTSGLHVVAIFFQGFVFHSDYLRRYFRFQAHPTRHAPPLPAEYPCVYFVIYEHGKILSQFMTQYRPEDFTALPSKPQVNIGPNRLSLDSAAGYQLHLEGTPWHLTWRGPKRPEGGRLTADLSFRPVFLNEPQERTFLSKAMTGAVHQWVIAAPLCETSGTVRIEQAGKPPREIAFTGRGYHDHNYGTAPLGPGLRRWIWGRILWETGVTTFHHACPRNRSLPDESHIVETSADGLVKRADVIQARWNRRTALGLRYPSELTVGPGLHLRHPRVVDAAPFYLRLMYDAVDYTNHPSRTATAFCEVAYPRRLRWPILGRMIEMSIQKP